MVGDVIIRAEGLGKKYVIGHQVERERYIALRDVIARQAQRFARSVVRGRGVSPSSTTEEFWALRDVSFDIRRGEVVGIIGRNGAGKSTLLKVLSRITEPSEGRVTIEGRVASLLEVGTGFHPELTGRENIYLNGAILGMTRAEIRRKFDEIVSFSEIERFLDTAVKRYSSGMYVRLAFAVAAHLEPEILVVDEVLAVGDAEFQKKCLGKMSKVAVEGRTVLFVSHNMAAVQALCPRSIHLAGKIVCDGETDAVVASYLDQRQTNSHRAGPTIIQEGLSLTAVRFAPTVLRTGDAAKLEFVFYAENSGQIRECAILLYSLKGFRVAILDVRESVALPFRYEKGWFSLNTRIGALPVVEGGYTIGLYLRTDSFVGDLMDLKDFTVHAAWCANDFMPYHADVRGILAVKSESGFVVEPGAQIAEGPQLVTPAALKGRS
jgi:lipopolysaccharide transport system ATP-binding protein